MAAPDPCILVIFGASGDLTHRKLIPALYELSRAGQHGDESHGRLPDRFAVIGVSRTPMSDEDFRAKMRESCEEFASAFDAASWNRFSPALHYCEGDAVKTSTYPGLLDQIKKLGGELGIQRSTGMPNILFYLSVSPNLYQPIIQAIGESGVVTEGKRWCSINPGETPWQRIIVEKPFGQDTQSAHELNMALGRVFEEEAIFRIDHYLGKELVQNLLVMRFANAIFEPVWNRDHIDHIQVTASETLGVGSRAANFYDTAGALRDMVQSHLLQILALVAIEPPTAFEAPAIMGEKIKLFNAGRIAALKDAPRYAALGRYSKGVADGKPSPAYTEEKGVEPARKTETYAAIKLEFDNWRWAGVPFYLRSGKKLAAKRTEIVIQFRRPPVNMFRSSGDAVNRLPGNRLVVSIAPAEKLELLVQGKVPGAGLRIDSTILELDYLERFGGEQVEAYGPLLLDAMRGDRTLYKHREEVEAGWRLVQPFLDSQELRGRIEDYAPGSWGPRSADQLLAADGRAWFNHGSS